jgi:hypothetical protein
MLFPKPEENETHSFPHSPSLNPIRTISRIMPLKPQMKHEKPDKQASNTRQSETKKTYIAHENRTDIDWQNGSVPRRIVRSEQRLLENREHH